MPKITKRLVDSLTPQGSDYFVWDDSLAGFGVRVMPTGRRTYMVQYRDIAGRTRRKRIGKHGTVTADEARADARQLL